MPLKNMDGDVPENGSEKSGNVAYDLLPTHKTKTLKSMKAVCCEVHHFQRH